MFKRLMFAAGAALTFFIAFGGGANQRAHGQVLELQPNAPGSSVVVDRVLDGDTVIVRGWSQRVRLANIDAPEMSHGYGRPGQPYSVQSSKWLAEQLEGKSGVTVKCVDKDRYGRRVCDFFRNGEHVNKAAVRAGIAWANTASARYLRDKSVLAAQEEARAARRGIWTQPSPTPPWQWRRECWDKGACS